MIVVSSAKRIALAVSASVAVLVLSGCGGGGGSSSGGSGTGTGSGTVVNASPQITSATTASLVENSTAAVLTLTATDAEGDAVTFSVSGGADAAAFQLSGSALQLRQTPDFERPVDSNRDNVYNVTVTAQDARGASSLANLIITVANSKEGIAVTRVATGFTDPVGLAFLLPTVPVGTVESGQIAVALANGQIFSVDGTTGARMPMADMFDGRPRGKLLAVTYNGRRNNFYDGLYAIAQEPGGRVFMQRYGKPRPIEELEILPNGSPAVAASLFNGPARGLPGGDLFMTLSDEQGTFAQNLASPLGKLIFLEDQDPYVGASTRPGSFVAQIIGSGIRRSGGAGAFNGEILLSDQGGSLEQELTSFLPNARPLDFGWPGREGTRGIGATPPAPINGPRVAYGFGTGADQGTGVIFGELYRGPIADLDNRFVFGDRSGTFWSIRAADLASGFLLGPAQMDRRTEDFVPNVGRIESPVAFAVDDRGRMFILDADGELFRIDAA